MISDEIVMVECPDCDGEGWVEWMEDLFCPHYGHKTRSGFRECENCQGEGLVYEEEVDT